MVDDYEEAEDDNDECEVSSEHDTIKVDNKRKNGHIKIQLKECDSIYILSTPYEFGVSLMHAKVLDFVSSS